MSDLCVKDGQTMVLIGDSITDCGRAGEAAPLGSGYVAFFVDLVMARHPQRKIAFINKGIGGNTTLDLTERWEADVLALRPGCLSVMIGINDLHRTLDGLFDIRPEIYRDRYTQLLERFASAVGSELVLIDPFYMITEAEADERQKTVLRLLSQYIEVVHDLAERFDARLVRTQEMFQKQLRYRPFTTFCAEPVHPNRTGHVLIAAELLKAMEA
jgi:lysophospholipase L1-like esterase